MYKSLSIYIFQPHAFATIAGIFIPALLPQGTILYEQGAHFLHGKNRENMMEISPDGFIQVPNKDYVNAFGDLLESTPIEIKCPFSEDNKVPVHYKIPVYYALQLMSEMKAKSAKRIWYASYCIKSTALLELTFEEVWNKMFGKIEDLFDSDIITAPKRKPEYRDEYRGLLKTYLDENTKVIADVPSLKNMTEGRDCTSTEGPYSSPSNVTKQHSANVNSITSQLQIVTQTS